MSENDKSKIVISDEVFASPTGVRDASLSASTVMATATSVAEVLK